MFDLVTEPAIYFQINVRFYEPQQSRETRRYIDPWNFNSVRPRS